MWNDRWLESIYRALIGCREHNDVISSQSPSRSSVGAFTRYRAGVIEAIVADDDLRTVQRGERVDEIFAAVHWTEPMTKVETSGAANLTVDWRLVIDRHRGVAVVVVRPYSA